MSGERPNAASNSPERKTGAYTERQPQQQPSKSHSRLAGKAALKATNIQSPRKQQVGSTAVKHTVKNTQQKRSR